MLSPSQLSWKTLPALVVCDLDGTLARSKVPCEPPIIEVATRLLAVLDFAIISGGKLELITGQFVDLLEPAAARSGRLHLLPASGSSYLQPHQSGYRTVYAHHLRPHDVAMASLALEKASRELGFWASDPHGEVMENRGGQLTYSALGQQAPLVLKEAWDPDGDRKRAIIAHIEAAGGLPGLELRAGKSTSIDVTAAGVDKGFGVRKLLDATGHSPEATLFLGDRLDAGGNDRPVIATGATCIHVAGPDESLTVLEQLLEKLKLESRVSGDKC